MDKPCTDRGAPLRILLADDSEMFRGRVRKLLSKTSEFLLVGEACDGEEAIRLAGELQPDVVIMDVAMPHLNGIEATREIKRAFSSITVIALSMHGDQGFRRAMSDAGASEYLLKDNVHPELVKVLRGLPESVT